MAADPAAPRLLSECPEEAVAVQRRAFAARFKQIGPSNMPDDWSSVCGEVAIVAVADEAEQRAFRRQRAADLATALGELDSIRAYYDANTTYDTGARAAMATLRRRIIERLGPVAGEEER